MVSHFDYQILDNNRVSTNAGHRSTKELKAPIKAPKMMGKFGGSKKQNIKVSKTFKEDSSQKENAYRNGGLNIIATTSSREP